MLLTVGMLPVLSAQPARKPFQAQSSSTIAFSVKNDESVVEIANVVYEVAGPGIPTRPPDELLVLRKTSQSRQVLGDIGIEAKTTVEAWPLGVDLTTKPRYTVALAGTDCQTVDNALLVISRGLEETEWWSVHQLATGALLFDTYVPLVRFSIARDIQTLRYVGLEAPADDTADARLKEPHVAAVVTYASAERVIREVLITAEDPKLASQLRSFADENRQVSLSGPESALNLKISFSQSYPAAPEAVTVTIPVAHDDLDLSHAVAPARIHVVGWKR